MAFRPASEAEVVVLAAQVGREVEALERDVRFLVSTLQGPEHESPALLLAREKLLRRRAVADEIAAGRLFVRSGPVPADAVADIRARGGDVALVSEGRLRGAVFLDPVLHPSWRVAREVWRDSGFLSPATSLPPPPPQEPTQGVKR